MNAPYAKLLASILIGAAGSLLASAVPAIRLSLFSKQKLIKKFEVLTIGFAIVLAIVSCTMGVDLHYRVWFVSPSGSDSHPGTSALPFLTIGHAASLVNPGDTVIVADGVYQEALNLTRGGTASAFVTFTSQNQYGAVLDGNNNTLHEGIQFTASFIQFRGFEVRGYGNNGSGDAFSTFPGGQFIDIVGNYVHDIGRLCTDTANAAGVGVFIESPNNTVEENIFADIGRYAPGENGCSPRGTQHQTHDHGIYLSSGSNHTTIKNNVFYRIRRGWGVQVYPDGFDSLAILNNTFIGDNPYRAGNIIIYTSSALTNLRIENNISYHPTTAFITFSTTTASGTIANNLVFGGTIGDASPSGITFSNNISGDPKLVNPGNTVIDSAPTRPDGHLLSGSPAIGAGLPLSDVTKDLDGVLRQSPPSIGAYEFVNAKLNRRRASRSWPTKKEPRLRSAWCRQPFLAGPCVTLPARAEKLATGVW